MDKKITKTWFEKLFVFFISIFLFSIFAAAQLGYSPMVYAESSAAHSTCNSKISDPANAPSLNHISKDQWLAACYFGYDQAGPDTSGFAESGHKKCFDKYGTSSERNLELTGACNVGAFSYIGDHPVSENNGDINFNATTSDGKPVSNVTILPTGDEKCVSPATTGGNGKASISCEKGREHTVSIKSNSPQYKLVSSNTMQVKVRSAEYKIKLQEKTQDIQAATQACTDRKNNPPDNAAPVTSIKDCVDGYLAQLDGKTKDEACSVFGQGLAGQDCGIGYDLAGAGPSGAAGDAPTECQGEGLSIGWVICGIVEAVSTFSQWVFNDFIQPLMENTPLSLDTADPFYKSWQGFRFIGNILLIGSFMAIVYSQARGGGGGQ